MLYVLCGISGAGKTAILNVLIQHEPRLGRLITYTTRLPRPGEVNHVDYHFTSEQPFLAEVEASHIVCPIIYRGAWYGTSRDDLQACASQDTLTILRPDKIGKLQPFTPTPLLGIYIVRPGHDKPCSEDDHIIVAHQHLCSYQIINISGDIDQAVFQILSLIRQQEAHHAHR
jgi:guanylate kinase